MTDQTRSTLDRLMGDVPIGPAPIDTLLTAGRRAKRRRRRAFVSGVASATALVLGGGALATQALTSTDGGHDVTEATSPSPTAESSQADRAAQQLSTGVPGVLIAEPEIARGGQNVRITFPNAHVRGVLYLLDAWDGQDWQTAFCLYSDGGGIAGWEISTKRYTSSGCAVRDIGIVGAGPDLVRMPREAPPGTYRLCTGNSQEKKCGLISVAAS